MTSVTSDSASGTFTPSDGNNEQYRVQAVLTNTKTGERKTVEVQGDTGVISFTGLEPETMYSVVTRGVTKDGRISDPTEAVTFTTGTY